MVGLFHFFWHELVSQSKYDVGECFTFSGGAVQGLREPIREEDPIYLNRANDGFIFFDNGCYTYGPLKRNNDDEDNYLHSLIVGNYKSRVVMSGNGHEEKSSAMLEWKKSGALFDDSPPMIKTEQAPNELKVDFVETIMCSKASPMQPWMLQRVKWQKETTETPGETTSEQASLNDSIIRCWSVTQSAPDFYEWISSSAPESEGTVVQAGALCEATGELNLIARHYDASDDLKQVLIVEGILRS